MLGFFILYQSLSLYAETFTLSDQALMALDWDADTWFDPAHTAVITDVRNVAGPGVEFDIYYPGNQAEDASMMWLSSKWGGNGSLADIDIHNYEAFALQFTILSIDGSSSSAITNPLIVGAAINLTDTSHAFKPEILRLSGPVSETSTTTSDAALIETIGFTAYIPYWWYDDNNPNPWNPDGSDITLLVQAADGAVVIPEPATINILGLGVLFLLRKRKK